MSRVYMRKLVRSRRVNTVRRHEAGGRGWTADRSYGAIIAAAGNRDRRQTRHTTISRSINRQYSNSLVGQRSANSPPTTHLMTVHTSQSASQTSSGFAYSASLEKCHIQITCTLTYAMKVAVRQVKCLCAQRRWSQGNEKRTINSK